MNTALAEGILGSGNISLKSAAQIGPNVYLGRNDFLKMLGFALGAHVLIFVAASLFPPEKVTNIPVRALSFKLGDQDRIAAFGVNTAPQPATPSPAPYVRPAPITASRTLPPPVPPVRMKPVAAITPAPTPTPLPKPYVPPTAAPAIAPTPQQYVREVGQAPQQVAEPTPTPTNAGYGVNDGVIGGVGTQNTQTAQTAQTVEAIRERYEQQISAWIERHKFYPIEAGGKEGRVVVRMRIDRSGIIRYYAIEVSSGISAIDIAAIDMVRRANPVPAVPANYPAGNLVEFLIPINFQAPQ